jgi:hypothetical protein
MMCTSYGHRFHGPYSMMGCCCGPAAWHQTTKEEAVEWLESRKRELETELHEIEREIERTKKPERKD